MIIPALLGAVGLPAGFLLIAAFLPARRLSLTMRPVFLLSFQHVTRKTTFLVFCDRSPHP